MTFALFQSLSWNLRCLTTTLSLGQAACDIFSVRSALRRQNAGADTGGLRGTCICQQSQHTSYHHFWQHQAIYAPKTERYGKCRLTYRTVSLLKVQAPVDRHPKWMITPEQDRSPAVYFLQSLRSFPASKRYWVNAGPNLPQYWPNIVYNSTPILASSHIDYIGPMLVENIGQCRLHYWINVGCNTGPILAKCCLKYCANIGQFTFQPYQANVCGK